MGVEHLDWVPNEDETRWFLVLRLREPPRDELKRCLRTCNLEVERYGQAPLYPTSKGAPLVDSASPFHISIGWSLSKLSSESFRIDRLSADQGEGLRVLVDSIKLKVGNEISTFSLKPKKGAVHSFID